MAISKLDFHLRSRSWTKFHVTKWSCMLLTHIPFTQCEVAILLMICLFQNLTLAIQSQSHIVQSHIVGPTSYRLTSLSFHVNQHSHSWDMVISKFDIKFQVQVHSWVKVKGRFKHSIKSIPFHCKSISVPIPEVQLFQNLTLKSSRGYWPISLIFCVNGPYHFWYTAISKFDLEI